MSGKQSATNLVAASVLAVLTLSVFYLLREFGPESAVRKFHRAVLSRNYAQLNEVIHSETDPVELDYLASRVWNFAATDGRFQIRSLQRSTDQVTAEVEYSFPNRALVVTTFWVITRESSAWKVNVNATAQMWKRGMIP